MPAAYAEAPRRGPLVDGLLTGQYALIVAYLVGITLPEGWIPAVVTDLMLLNLVFVVAATLLLLRARRSRSDRSWAVTLALGLLTFLVANLVYAAAADGLTSEVLAEALYLPTYPFLAAAVVLVVRRYGPTLREGMVVEALLGGLAAVTLAAAVVHPLLDVPAVEPSEALVVSLYPVLDLLFLSVVVGGVALSGGFVSAAHRGTTVGLVVFGVSDLFYVRASLLGTYEVGHLLDVGWPLGAALMAHGAWAAERPREHGRHDTPAMTSLTVTAASSWVGVLLLVVAALLDLPWFVVVLAAATLVLSLARTTQAMWRLQDLARLRQEVSTDALTGLLSRRAFYDRIDGVLGQLVEDEVVGIGLVDLDRFKQINDTHGHATGDQVLATFGERVRAAAAAYPAPVSVARLGGDEFALVVSGVASVDHVEELGRVIGDAARFRLGDEIEVSASVGLATAPTHGTHRSDLLRAADRAMYAAKEAGRDRVVVHDPQAEPAGRRPVVRG